MSEEKKDVIEETLPATEKVVEEVTPVKQKKQLLTEEKLIETNSPQDKTAKHIKEEKKHDEAPTHAPVRVTIVNGTTREAVQALRLSEGQYQVISTGERVTYATHHELLLG